MLLGILVPRDAGAQLAARGQRAPASARRVLDAATREAQSSSDFAGADVTLSGWRFPSQSARRGHGRLPSWRRRQSRLGSVTGAALFAPRLRRHAYDSRAHGDSGGEMCTFGLYESGIFQRVIDCSRAVR